MERDEYWYWLATIEQMWAGKIEKLIEHFKNPENMFKASISELKRVQGLGSKDVEKIIFHKKNADPRRDLEQLRKDKINFVYWDENEFPEKLRSIFGSPYFLFYKGTLPDPNKETIAMVGSRNASEYGKKTAETIGVKLAEHNVQVVSGMARGIDAYSLWGGLKGGGKCFAVLGSGVDICYPWENRKLYEEIICSGGVMSEYPPGVKPLAWHFPHRNRIISGLSDKLVVVEAKKKSGTFITVDCALEQGKDVFSIPGRITDTFSYGCNQLIKQGANILTELSDLISEDEKDLFEIKNRKPLEKELEVLYSDLDLYPKSLNTIIEETKLSPKAIICGLVKLKLLNLIEEPMKNYYVVKG